MKLIVDSGSTKTDWILAETKQSWKIYSTVGYNPYFVDTQNIYISIRESLLEQWPPGQVDQVKEICYYGTGCSTPENSNTVRRALERAFPKAAITVEHDLLAAARALLGSNSGFASILGTGTNTCLYDGKKITLCIDSLGYLLGDEGSGCYIGRIILRNYMRRLFDAELTSKFIVNHREDNEDIFKETYNALLPNRYLASYATFAGENKDHPQIKAIVKEAFADFFRNLVSKYPNYKSYQFNSLGTIGHIFQDVLREVVAEFGMEVGMIMRKPIEGLLAYHFPEEK